MSPKMTMNLVIGAFTLFGLVFIGAGVATGIWSYAFVASAERAQGVVLELERSRSSESSGSTMRPVVRFETPDGREIVFTESSGSRPPVAYPGDSVSVLYDPERPERASLDGFFALWGIPAIFAGFGSLLFLVGVGTLGYTWRRRRQAEELKRSGLRIEATIRGVELNKGLSVNGRYPHRIVCQWHNNQTGEVHVFHSEDFWYDPSDHLPGPTIGVMIDPARPRRFWVDTSSLPKLAS